MNNYFEYFSPKNRAMREIKYMLYNYNKIDTLIENRKKELIETMNLSTSAWLRGINQESNTFENVIAGFDDDWKIRRYKHWKSFISKMIEVFKNIEAEEYYEFLQLKYFRNLNAEQIIKEMNITEEKLKIIATNFNCILYRCAIKNNLFEKDLNDNALL